jgi:hypothetical protein
MTKESALVFWIALLSLADVVVPLPVLGFILLWVVATRPPWFWRIASEVYERP